MVIHVSKNDRLRLQNVESKTNQWHHGGDDPIRGLYPRLPHIVTRKVIKYDIMASMNRFRWLFALPSVRLWVFSTSGSAAVIVCQKLSFLLKLWSHTYRCTRTASLLSFLQTSVPSFIRVLLFSASWWRTTASWHTGAATPFTSDGNESTAWAHEGSGFCSLSLHFYSLNFWFSFTTSAFQNETLWQIRSLVWI